MERAGRVSLYTLGCKLNFSETSSIGQSLLKEGYEIVPYGKPADYLVVNTCSVTDHADRKCKKVVREGLRHSPNAKVAIIGCYAQLKPDEILEIPGVNLVLGSSEKFNLPQRLKEIEVGQKEGFVSDIAKATSFIPSQSGNTRTRVFLKVQDGCSYNCSFCTIPLARGESRSGSIAQVIEQVSVAAGEGAREIVLTGINLGDFGHTVDDSGISAKKSATFLNLIQELDARPYPVRYRISSIEPNLLTDEIIDFVAGSQKFVPHFHIPLQSGSNTVLADMRRRYKREIYQSRVERIKAFMPNACIGCDVIVGFPTETSADFEQTYEFLEALPVDYLHVFPYSERPNTHAISFETFVVHSVRSERCKRLTQLSDDKKTDFYKSQLNATAKVLFEHENLSGWMEGYSENYVRVSHPYDPLLAGELIDFNLEKVNQAGIVEGTEDLQIAEIVSELEVL